MNKNNMGKNKNNMGKKKKCNCNKLKIIIPTTYPEDRGTYSGFSEPRFVAKDITWFNRLFY